MEPWEQDEIVEGTKAKPWEQDELVEDSSSVGGYAKGFAGGFNIGLASMAGAPVDITNALLNVVGLGTEEPKGGSKQIKGLMKKAGMLPEPPDTALGRGVARVGEELGATVVPSGLLFRGARGLAPISRIMESKTKQVLQGGLLDPIRRAPGAAAIGELAATVGAGTGAGIAQEVAPESKGAEITGQLVGGVTPVVVAVTPTAMATRVVRSLTSRFSSKAQTAASKKVVEALIGEELSHEARRSLKEAGRVSAKIKGLKPSVPEATGSPALIAQQKQLEANAKGAALNKFVARHRANETAIDTFIGKKAPQSDVDVEYVIDAAQNRVKTIGEKITALEAKNLSSQERAALNLPEVNKITEGTMMRDALVQRRAEVSAKMSVRAEELGINSANMEAPYNAWRAKVIEKYKPGSRFYDKDNMPAIYKFILRDKTTKKGAVSPILDKTGREIVAPDKEIRTTFQDLKTLRERVTDDLIDSVGAASPNRIKIRFLSSLKKDVDGLVDSIGDIGPNYKQFREEYFNEYIKPFEQGAIFKIKDKNMQGFYKTSPEKIADSFLANESSARQFQEIFGKDPEMVGALKNSLLDNMRQKTIKDGVVNEKLFSKWLLGKKKILNEIPDLTKVVSKHEQAQSALFSRQSQLAKRRLSIEKNAITKQLTRYEGGVSDADKILKDALKVPDRMKSLMSYIKTDKNAVDGLKKAVWDKAASGDSKQTLNFLRDNEKSLRLLFGKEHLANINDISLAQAMVESVPTPSGSVYVPRPLENIEGIIGQGIPQIGSRVFAWKSGRMQKGYLFLDTMMRGLRGRSAVATEKMLSEALYDPMVAKEMAESFTGAAFNETKAKALNSRLFALGLPYTEETQEKSND
jgi:hypothetical protein